MKKSAGALLVPLQIVGFAEIISKNVKKPLIFFLQSSMIYVYNFAQIRAIMI